MPGSHSVIGLNCAEAIDDEGAHQPIDLLILDLGLPGEQTPSHLLTLQVSWLTVQGIAGTVKLTRPVAIMLTAFARAPGQVLESWQIMELLGEDPETYTRNGLEARIARLRSKLVHAGSDAGCIRSIRSSGYQLCVRLRIL